MIDHYNVSDVIEYIFNCINSYHNRMSIPNVSAIYRDLSHLHENVEGGKTHQPTNQFKTNYSLENQGTQKKNGFE